MIKDHVGWVAEQIESTCEFLITFVLSEEVDYVDDDGNYNECTLAE